MGELSADHGSNYKYKLAAFLIGTPRSTSLAPRPLAVVGKAGVDWRLNSLE